MTNDLITFLRARLDEREQAARYSDEHAPSAHMTDPNGERHSPARVLADVEAKRRIIDLYERDLTTDGGYLDGWHEALEAVVRLHAAVHADHPDYREEWRP